MNKKVKAFIDIYSELENNFSDFEKYLDAQDKKLSEYIRSYILSLSTDKIGFDVLKSVFLITVFAMI